MHVMKLFLHKIVQLILICQYLFHDSPGFLIPGHFHLTLVSMSCNWDESLVKNSSEGKSSGVQYLGYMPQIILSANLASLPPSVWWSHPSAQAPRPSRKAAQCFSWPSEVPRGYWTERIQCLVRRSMSSIYFRCNIIHLDTQNKRDNLQLDDPPFLHEECYTAPVSVAHICPSLDSTNLPCFQKI